MWWIEKKSHWNPADSVQMHRLFSALIIIMDFALSKEKKKLHDCLNGNEWYIFNYERLIVWLIKPSAFVHTSSSLRRPGRAHSLSPDEVWWWGLMMSASSHHHLASSTTLFSAVVFRPAVEAISDHSLRASERKKPSLKPRHNKWKCKTFVVVNMQISLLTYSRGSVYLLPPSAVGEMHSGKKKKKKGEIAFARSVCERGRTLCWLCSRYGCHISAGSTSRPAVCGEKTVGVPNTHSLGPSTRSLPVSS